MSRHTFSQNGMEINMGYDRPLDYVFCTVTLGPNEDYVYSNLDDVEALNCQDIEYYRPILAKIGVTPPEAMFEQVKRDQTNKMGNSSINFNDRAESVSEDAKLNAKQLAEKYGWWEAHPVLSPADWEQEAFDGNTRLGYWEWVVSQIESAKESEA